MAMRKSDGLGEEVILLPAGSIGRVLPRIWVFSVQVFFCGMLVLPTTFQFQRGVALAVLMWIAGLLARRQWRVHGEILFLWLATMVVGIFGITWGVMNDAPGALRVSTVYLLWPTVYLLFIGLAHGLPIIRHLHSVLLLGISLATTMALTVLLAGLMGFGEIVYPLLAFQDAGFGVYEGFVEFRIHNLTTVMYGFPFVLSLVLVRRDEFRGLSKIGNYLLLFAISLTALGSGRRAFWLVMLVSPFITLLFLQLSSCRLRAVPFLWISIKFSAIAIALITCIVVTVGLDPIALVENFVAAFQGREESSGIRYLQAVSLWEAYAESPLIGQGLGSAVDVVRSHDTPWAYELSFLALLMNVGTIGFLVYSTVVICITLRGVAISRKNTEFAKLFVPLITSLVAFLIMNATNPYLQKFDYLWVVFLPVALINAYSTRRTKYD